MAETVYDVRQSRLNPNRYRLVPRPKGSRTAGHPPHGETRAKRTKPAAYLLVDDQGQDAASEYRDKEIVCPRCGKVMKFTHVYFGNYSPMPAFECERCAVDCENNPINAL